MHGCEGERERERERGRGKGEVREIEYCIGGIFRGVKFSRISQKYGVDRIKFCFLCIIFSKTRNSRKIFPMKYSTYTVNREMEERGT